MSDAVPLEESPFFEKTNIRHASNFKNPPSVALHLLTKNAESCLGRLLGNVGPYLSEVVAVVNDTTDDTVKILESWGKEYGKRVDVSTVTAESHPHLYFVDEKDTYEKEGRALCGEVFSDEFFTNRPVLADWAGIRNIAWERCQADWRLFLDSDDVVQDPEAIWGVCELLNNAGADIVFSRYDWNVDEQGRSSGTSYRERITRNIPEVRWIYPIHEVLFGYERQVFIQDNLRVTDQRDSRGEGIRIPGRNFKVLYQFARSRDWDIPPRMLLQLAEASTMMPEFAKLAIQMYLDRSSWHEERAWAWRMKGEIFEREGNFEKASECFESSLHEHPGTKSAFALCRSRFNEKKWQLAIDAYNVGVENAQAFQILDDGPMARHKAQIFVACAYGYLGHFVQALAIADEALKSYPRTSPLLALREEIVRASGL